MTSCWDWHQKAFMQILVGFTCRLDFLHLGKTCHRDCNLGGAVIYLALPFTKNTIRLSKM